MSTVCCKKRFIGCLAIVACVLVLGPNTDANEEIPTRATKPATVDEPEPNSSTETKPKAPSQEGINKSKRVRRYSNEPLPTGPIPFGSRTAKDRSKEPLKLTAGIFELRWEVLTSTTFEGAIPKFPVNLKPVDERTVLLEGYMSPLDDGPIQNLFLLIECPSNCTYCETPDPTGLVLIELRDGERERLHYGMVTVLGTMALNADDPDDFMYIISEARIINRR